MVELEVTERFDTVTLALATLRFCGVAVTEMDLETSIWTGSPTGEKREIAIVTGELPVIVPARGMVRVKGAVPFLGSETLAPSTESLPMTVLPFVTVITAYPVGEPAAALGRSGSKLLVLVTTTAKVPPVSVADEISDGSDV